MLLTLATRRAAFQAAPAQPVYFIGREQEDGDFCILNVDVFGKGPTVPVAALSPEHIKMRTDFVNDKWLDGAATRHARMRATNGYVPPIHVWHNNDETNDNRDSAGFGCDMRRGRGGQPAALTEVRGANGQPQKILAAADSNKDVLYMNFRSIPREVFMDLVLKKRLPFRSVEIQDTAVPDIASVALMFSTPPFFALRPLNVFFDTSKKEPAFNFEPVGAAAQFSASKTTKIFYMGVSPMKVKLKAICAAMRAGGIATKKDEALIRLKLMFAADTEPPKEEEMQAAVDEEFAAEADEDKDEDDKAKPDAATLAADDKDKPAGPTGPAVEPGPTEPQDDVMVEPQPELKLEGGDAPVVQPAAPAAAPAGGAADAAGGIAQMIEAALGDALAPLVQEIRALLSSGAVDAAPGTDGAAPLAVMQAKLKKDFEALVPQLRKRYAGKAPAKPAPANGNGNGHGAASFDAKSFAKDVATEISAQFGARLTALETAVGGATQIGQRNARVASFKALIDDEIAKGNGALSVRNPNALAEQAADMPDKQVFKVQNPATGKITDVYKDLGELHIRTVLASSGGGQPAPAAFDASGRNSGGFTAADPDVDCFKHHTAAFNAAKQYATEYDQNPTIQRVARSGRTKYVAGLVFADTGVQPK